MQLNPERVLDVVRRALHLHVQIVFANGRNRQMVLQCELLHGRQVRSGGRQIRLECVGAEPAMKIGRALVVHLLDLLIHRAALVLGTEPERQADRRRGVDRTEVPGLPDRGRRAVRDHPRAGGLSGRGAADYARRDGK